MTHLRKRTTILGKTSCVGVTALFFGAQVHGSMQSQEE